MVMILPNLDDFVDVWDVREDQADAGRGDETLRGQIR